MKVIDYIYYRSFDLLGLMGNYNLPRVTVRFVSVLVNVFAINIYFIIGNEIDLLYISIVSVIIFLLCHVFLYSIFLKNDGYIEVIKRFSSEDMVEKVIGRIVLLIIFVFLIINCL